MTTGATGEATNNSKTDGEEARGGERGMHARENCLETRSTGGGISGGGERGDQKPSMGQSNIVLNLRPESSGWVSSARGWNSTTL